MARRLCRRASADHSDRRTGALYDAALTRLATKDYEEISIASLARGAGCSVGAFYSRFQNKETFLRFVTASAFLGLTESAKRDLAPERLQHESKDNILDAVVRHIASRMNEASIAGVTRAAVKLSMTNPEALAPLLQYRENVAGCAVELLAPRGSLSGTARSVRAAVQITFGIVIDCILSNTGPLRAGSRRLTNTLSALMRSYVQLPANGPQAKDGGKGSGTKKSERQGAELPIATQSGRSKRSEKQDSRQRVVTISAEDLPSRSRGPSGNGRRKSKAPIKSVPAVNPKDHKALEPVRADDIPAGPQRGRRRRIRPI